jgi:hypothetical protein
MSIKTGLLAIIDKAVDGSAKVAWMADGKLREFMYCSHKTETQEFVDAFKENLHHIAHCHVCRGMLVKALKNIPDIDEPKTLIAE